MSYLRKISVKIFHHFKYNLSNTQKGICLILAASLIVKIGELVFKLIVENQYTFGFIIGMIIFAIGIYLYFKRQGGVKDNQKSYDLEDKNNSTINHDINTGGGNYNRVEGNYIQGDYINIQDKRVDMSKDITSILNDQYSGQFLKRDAMASASNAYAIKHRSKKSECNLNQK